MAGDDEAPVKVTIEGEDKSGQAVDSVKKGADGLVTAIEGLNQRLDQQFQTSQEKQVRDAEAAAEKKALAAEKAAERQAKAAENAAKKEQQAWDNALSATQGAFTRMAVVAGAASAAILAGSEKSVEAYAQLQRAVESTNAIEQAYLGTQGQALAIAQKVSEDGLIPLNATLTATRRILESGLGAEQTGQLLLRMKDAAALARREGMDMSTAMDNLSRAFETGQSRLARNSGLIVDFKEAVNAGTKELGLHKDQLTVAEEAQARFIGVMQQSQGVIGGTAKMQNTLSSEMSQAKTAGTELAQTVGEALAPAYQRLISEVTGVSKDMKDFVSTHPEVVRALTTIGAGAATGAAAVTGLAAAVMAAIKAFTAFAAATNPVWAAIAIGTAALGALIGAFVGANLAAEANRQAFAQQTNDVVDLANKYQTLRTIVEDTNASDEQKRQAQSELTGIMQKLGDLMPEVVSQWNAEGKAIGLNSDALQRNLELRKAKVQRDAEDVLGKKGHAVIDLQKQLQEEQAQLERMQVAPNEYAIVDPMSGLTIQTGEEELKNQADLVRKLTRDLGVAQKELQVTVAQAYPDLSARDRRQDELDHLLNDKPFQSPADRKAKTGGATHPQMSEALQAALQDLQDIKASDAVDKLEQEQKRMREIMDQFAGELANFPREQRLLLRRLNEELPREIGSRDFHQALSDLMDTSTLEEWSKKAPEKLKAGLEGIKQQFAGFLADPHNRSLAQGLDQKIATAGKDITDEARRQAKDLFDAAMEEAKNAGKEFGTGAEIEGLKKALLMAFGLDDKEMKKQVLAITGQIHDLMRQEAKKSFDERLQDVGEGYTSAMAKLGPQLQELEKKLIDASVNGDATAGNQAQQQVLALTKPILEAKRKALQDLLASITGADEESQQERKRVETELNTVNKDLYSHDLENYRLTLAAKVAAARTTAEAIKTVNQQALDDLAKARKADIDSIKERQKAEEEAAQDVIQGLQNQLELMRRRHAEAKRQRDEGNIQKEIDAVKAAGGFQTFDPKTGRMVETFDEAKVRDLQQKLADMHADDREREAEQALQDQIKLQNDLLGELRRHHQVELAAREAHWTLVDKQAREAFASIEKSHGDHLTNILADLKKKVPELNALWDDYAKHVQSAVAAAATAKAQPAAGGTTAPGGTTDQLKVANLVAQGVSTDQAAKQTGFTGEFGGHQYQSGAPVAPTAPTAPVAPPVAPYAPVAPFVAPYAPVAPGVAAAGAAASTVSLHVGAVHVSLPSVTDANGFAQALPGALAAAAAAPGGISMSRLNEAAMQAVRGGAGIRRI